MSVITAVMHDIVAKTEILSEQTGPLVWQWCVFILSVASLVSSDRLIVTSWGVQNPNQLLFIGVSYRETAVACKAVV